MNDRRGLLVDSERSLVNERLRLLEEDPITGDDELLLASAVQRASSARDTLVMPSLAMSMVALAVAVVIGGIAMNDYVLAFLVGYLVLAGIVVIATHFSVHRSVTAEVVRVIVVRRLELRQEAAHAHDDGERFGIEVRRTRRRGALRRALRRLTRSSA